MDLRAFSLKQNSLFKCRLQPSAVGWARALPAPRSRHRQQMVVGKARTAVGSACQSRLAAAPHRSHPAHVLARVQLWRKRGGVGLGGAGCLGPAAGWGCGQHQLRRVHRTSEHRLCLSTSSIWLHNSTREELRELQDKVLRDQTAQVKPKSKSL